MGDRGGKPKKVFVVRTRRKKNCPPYKGKGRKIRAKEKKGGFCGKK